MIKAFTLAEVLITLGIIGVVSAMTMPTLILKQQQTQAITAVQKAYSLMNQNLKLAEVQNGSPSTWIGNLESPSYYTTLRYFNEYIKPYYKIINICTGEKTFVSDYYKSCGYESFLSKRSGGWQNNDLLKQYGNRVVFETADGMVYFFYPYATYCTEKDTSTPDNPQYSCYAKSAGSYSMSVDINGPKNPNTWGKDIFNFVLDSDKGIIMPSGYKNSPEDIDKDCSKDNYQGGLQCAAKLMKDGWKMGKNYPW